MLNPPQFIIDLTVMGKYFLEQAIRYPHSNNNIDTLRNRINIFLGDQSLFSRQSIKQRLFRNRPEIDSNRIQKDFDCFADTGMLTSRLAIVIYKTCTYDFYASDTQIGNFFKDILGKSRNFNNIQFDIKNTKGYKVYDINYTDAIIIRKDIATKLQEKGVPEEIIFYATGISGERW